MSIDTLYSTFFYEIHLTEYHDEEVDRVRSTLTEQYPSADAAKHALLHHLMAVVKRRMQETGTGCRIPDTYHALSRFLEESPLNEGRKQARLFEWGIAPRWA